MDAMEICRCRCMLIKNTASDELAGQCHKSNFLRLARSKVDKIRYRIIGSVYKCMDAMHAKLLYFQQGVHTIDIFLTLSL